MKRFCLIEFTESDELEIKAIFIQAETDEMTGKIREFIQGKNESCRDISSPGPAR